MNQEQYIKEKVMHDLRRELSILDKKRITNYVKIYGAKNHFIGVRRWLQQWDYSNQTLYKLLGNNLIWSKEFCYEKPEEELRFQLETLTTTHPFTQKWKLFINYLGYKNDKYPYFKNNLECISDKTTFSNFHFLLKPNNIYNNTISVSIKERKPNCNRELRLQSGGKLMKAISKIISYYDEEVIKYNIQFEEDLYKEFEDFRIAHSRILNDKKVKGNLCISIHPLDYMTMSDNASSWSSCMSWQTDGCYKIGTVEMMNSNNVLCCYITSSNEYNFSKEHLDEEEYTWNNKKWRQLFYIDKDIIVGGKAYPYYNEFFTKVILNNIKELINKNLGWDYKYGPELYKDMIHINGLYSMERAHKYLNANNNWKKNILFDTKGMYNDMLNDSSTKYWCYRNKVKKTKFIKYSGKTSCLCCGCRDNILNEEFYDVESYNDRFNNTDNLICGECYRDYFFCDRCCDSDSLANYYKIYIKDKNDTRYICQYCFDNAYKKCPDCGNIFKIDDICGGFYTDSKYLLFIRLTSEKNINLWSRWFDYFKHDKGIKPLFACPHCIEKYRDKFEKISVHSNFHSNFDSREFNFSKEIYDINDPKVSKYFYENLESLDPEKDVV